MPKLSRRRWSAGFGAINHARLGWFHAAHVGNRAACISGHRLMIVLRLFTVASLVVSTGSVAANVWKRFHVAVSRPAPVMA